MIGSVYSAARRYAAAHRCVAAGMPLDGTGWHVRCIPAEILIYLCTPELFTDYYATVTVYPCGDTVITYLIAVQTNNYLCYIPAEKGIRIVYHSGDMVGNGLCMPVLRYCEVYIM